MKSEEGWIEWNGGGWPRFLPHPPFPPIERTDQVETLQRDGRKTEAASADLYRWHHLQKRSDIIAYRVVRP